MSYTNVTYKDPESGEQKTVLVQLVKVEPVNLVDTERIVWKDPEGREVVTKRVVEIDGKQVTIEGRIPQISTSGLKDDQGRWIPVPTADQIPYKVNPDGSEEQTTEFEMNLKKEGFTDFSSTIPIEEADGYLYTDVYEVTSSEKDMYELYKFAKMLSDSKQAAVCGEIVASKGFHVTGGLIVAHVDEKTKTFTVQMRRVTQKFSTSLKNPIPAGPYVAPPKKGGRGGKGVEVKKLF